MTDTTSSFLCMNSGSSISETCATVLNQTLIPKLNCVFTIEIDDFISYIYGSKFQLRASERSAKKFKVKGTIDL
ncbi:Ribonuclease P protein subunit p29 [Cricetulus griseus]|uniref:Ribonuclease P protein subunit p29 n=1 Tax=Cricetulus griseus TaxID=10029 RepID=G3IHG2_CRIGR|nr:Ribonuclease P protein subunit p29 [Cricetulus griseus]